MRLSLPILREVRACTECAGKLPNEPRPLLAASKHSRILIIGQAPGRVAHDTGVPWNDRSGIRLREWLGLSPEQFYDDTLVALMPMGFCFPGTGKGGDMAPRPECAPLWHPRLLAQLPRVNLTVYIGRYAYERYLPELAPTLTEAVRASRRLLPERILLPHPSPRNQLWIARNKWFTRDIVPALSRRVAQVLSVKP